MSIINYPFPDVIDKYDDVIESLIKYDDGDKLELSLQIVGKNNKIHSLHFNQVKNLIDLLTNAHPATQLPPQLYLINEYMLDDLKAVNEKGFVITEYSINVKHLNHQAEFEGTLSHTSTIESHPDYNAESKVGTKSFKYTLNNFGTLHQIAISKSIGGLHEELESFKSTYGISYIFNWSRGTINIDINPEDDVTL